jgi:hypothetical protein
MKKLRAWLARALCDHRIRLENMRRLDDDLVVCPCHLCGAVLTARYGAALNGKWVPDAAGVLGTSNEQENDHGG